MGRRLDVGLAGRRGKGRIEVRAERAGGAVRLSVRDNGPGPGARVPGSGLGLRNTEERLRQMYGDAHRLELAAAEDGGARAVVELPYRPAPA